ncbi:MAG: hypothetical protein JSV50_09200 [Desulfobacteraceae bacterium]|nr:MAG: hypothetical protein JSV50_09200 [Desulfobacteraceae bacterium]
MFRLNDFILLMIIFSSMRAGILLPSVGSVFQPYPVYLMMILLFLSFLSIKIETIWDTVRNHTQTVIWLSFLKLIALPLTVYFLFKVFCPSYAIAALEQILKSNDRKTRLKGPPDLDAVSEY